MDAKTETLIPADQLARDNPIRIPNESAEYRAARTALLAEEIELRRHIERVAADAPGPAARRPGHRRLSLRDRRRRRPTSPACSAISRRW